MKVKIKKVKATIEEIYCEPEYEYKAKCPYCGFLSRDEVFEDNNTIKINCSSCKKDFKIKIPKFY